MGVGDTETSGGGRRVQQGHAEEFGLPPAPPPRAREWCGQLLEAIPAVRGVDCRGRQGLLRQAPHLGKKQQRREVADSGQVWCTPGRNCWESAGGRGGGGAREHPQVSD